jgi:hypothetical protein
LSTSAKAGTAIVVMLGVAAIAGIVFFVNKAAQKHAIIEGAIYKYTKSASEDPIHTSTVQGAIPHSNYSPVEFFAPQT